MLEGHGQKLVFRSLITVIVFSLAVLHPSWLYMLFFWDFGLFSFYHVAWLFMMLGMLQVFFPTFNKHVSCGRHLAKHFQPTAQLYTEEQLMESVRTNNLGALRSALFWAVLLSVIGLLRYLGILGARGIHLLVVFFYFADEFCINVWCPFRAWVIRNLCCNTCRIFNWGHFMIFSPYLFLPSFWTLSLVAVSAAILLQWEVMHARHADRFSAITNANLQCINCLKAQCHYAKGRQAHT